MKQLHELRINDPEALVTTQGVPDYSKSDVAEMGVNTFISLPTVSPIEGATTGEHRARTFKRVAAAVVAVAALSPAGLARSVEVTNHLVEVPIREKTTVEPYDWDKTTRGKRTDRAQAQKVAEHIERAVEQAEDAARAQVPKGGTVTHAESYIDMMVTGGTDDSHRVGPASNDRNLGKKDKYNNELGDERAEHTLDDVKPEVDNRGVDVRNTTTGQHEQVLTPEEIKLGDRMARQYGYGDFDELIQAIGHDRVRLTKDDQKAYDRMITNARKSTIQVDGKATLGYTTSAEKVVIGVPNGLVGIATEEHAKVRGSQWNPPVRVSKKEIRGGVLMRPQGGGAVRKTGGATFRGSRHQGAFLPNSR